jgi:DNA polymerase III sliding clamp (beta) subunit (PCNA family)
LSAAAAKELVTACKLAAKGKRILRLSVNGSLVCTTKSEEYGDTSLTISAGYTHTGPDMTLAINPKFLADAIYPKAPVTIRLQDPASPLYITDDGTHEAAVMPMHLN